MTFRITALDQEIRAIGTGWPPLKRAMTLAVVHIGIFMAICCISYLRLPMGDAIAGGLLGLLALTSPLTGMLFILTTVNFQYLFWFDPSALYRIGVVLSAAYVLRSLPIILPEARRCSPLLIVLAAFIGILVLHFSETNLGKDIPAVGFCALTAAVFLHARSLAGTAGAAEVITTVCLGGLLACVLSFAYLYLPAPELFLSHSPLYDLRDNDLRLSGAQDSPNAIAKLALPGIIALMLMVLAWCRPIALWALLLVVGAILVVAAASKSILGCLLLSGVVSLRLVTKRRLLIAWCTVAVVVIGAAFVFSAAVFPLVKSHAADFWKQYSEPNMKAAHYAQLARESYPRILIAEFRIKAGEEAEHSKGSRRSLAGEEAQQPSDRSSVDDEAKKPNGPGRLLAEEVFTTGQRLLLFRSGIKIVSEHPLWGIGYKQWPAAIKEITGTSFGSPHNGLLEIWGSYGVLGSLLYLGLIVVAVRNYIVIERNTGDLTSLWLNRGIGLFLLALLLHELVEVATILAVTPYALWAWTALGLQDGMLRQVKSGAN